MIIKEEDNQLIVDLQRINDQRLFRKTSQGHHATQFEASSENDERDSPVHNEDKSTMCIVGLLGMS